MKHALTVLFVVALTTSAAAQDWEFIRAVERAQADRPQALASSARIAPESEPGTPLVLRGRLVAEDGATPVAGAVVFAYHTDREGRYDQPRAGAHSWRLKGWAKTDDAGRFEFRTIRPGEYPSRATPAHVHFTVFQRDARYHAGEVQFADDTLVPSRDRAASDRQGEFGQVRPVRQQDGVQHVEFAIRLNPRDRF